MPTFYEDEPKILNKHNGDVPPHPDRSIIEGEVGTGEAGIVEEPMEVVVVVDATFDRPCLFIHAPRNEC